MGLPGGRLPSVALPFLTASRYTPRVTYRSPLPWLAPRLRAAAMYCSDGRVGEHFDDFLQNGLNLPRYDRIALPGGCACLAGHPGANVEAEGVAKELHFLVEAHELERVVLIAHQGCAYYGLGLALPAEQIEPQQRTDLRFAANRIRELTGIARIEGWFLRIEGEAVSFEPVPLQP